jgi:hypothetical protein
MEKDTILVCFENIIQIVDIQGFPKAGKKFVSRIEFSFYIDSLGKIIFKA